MEENFGGCRLWGIHYKNTLGKKTLGNMNLIMVLVLHIVFLAEETSANLWSFTKFAKVSLYMACMYLPRYVRTCVGIF